MEPFGGDEQSTPQTRHKAKIELGVNGFFPLILGLVEEFPLNNAIHNSCYSAIQLAFETDAKLLKQSLFEDAGLVEFLIKL